MDMPASYKAIYEHDAAFLEILRFTIDDRLID